MKVLFVMLHPGFIRYYDGALRLLAAAGHEVHLAFEVTRDKLGEDVTARSIAVVDGITCGTTPGRAESVRDFLARGDRTALRSGDLFRPASPREARELAWESLATTVRLLLDYLRFFEPAFARAHALRDRAEKRLPRLHARLIRLVARAGGAGRSVVRRILLALERAIPAPPALEEFIRRHDPDLLLVTPLIELGSQQVDYVKCAQRLGVRSALAVASWDNLTSKGLIRVVPDHVLVWNDIQAREAAALHGVPRDRVVVTGAQLFDEWFAARPSRTREEFCQMVGLDPARPFVLYVGSSMFIAPDEVPFAERWLARLRRDGNPAVSGAGVLVRPHPANARQWRAFEPAASNVAIWPPIGTDPNAPDFRRDYFDSLYYSAAVVGINTSAQLEAGIVGRPVLTIRAPEFAHAQQGTLHFQHLVETEGGLVQEAQSLDEHVRQLGAALRRAGDAAAANARFVRGFIRPHGIDVPAAPVFVGAVEEIARRPRPAPRRDPAVVTLGRPVVVLLAHAARVLAEDRPLWVYALRPAVTLAVWIAAAFVWFGGPGAEHLYLALKRARRGAHDVWYESSRRVAKRLRRANKALARGLRTAGVAAKRVVRRSA